MSELPPIIPLSDGKYLIPNPAAARDIARTVIVEHAGEKISIEVHVHLTPEEIRRIVVPAVIEEVSRQMVTEIGQSIGGVM